jgi:hypothetical protein
MRAIRPRPLVFWRRGGQATLVPVGGMLEHATLLLRPPDAKSAQDVVDPSTGVPLGFARPRRLGFWDRVFGGVLVEVHECEDASLLCVIRRGRLWPYSRMVYDADGLLVGAVHGRRLEDPAGRPFAECKPEPNRTGDAYQDADGRTLATLRRSKEGVSVAFTEAIAADPFAKMLVLAAALRT